MIRTATNFVHAAMQTIGRECIVHERPAAFDRIALVGTVLGQPHVAEPRVRELPEPGADGLAVVGSDVFRHQNQVVGGVGRRQLLQEGNEVHRSFSWVGPAGAAPRDGHPWSRRGQASGSVPAWGCAPPVPASTARTTGSNASSHSSRCRVVPAVVVTSGLPSKVSLNGAAGCAVRSGRSHAQRAMPCDLRRGVAACAQQHPCALAAPHGPLRVAASPATPATAGP